MYLSETRSPCFFRSRAYLAQAVSFLPLDLTQAVLSNWTAHVRGYGRGLFRMLSRIAEPAPATQQP